MKRALPIILFSFCIFFSQSSDPSLANNQSWSAYCMSAEDGPIGFTSGEHSENLAEAGANLNAPTKCDFYITFTQGQCVAIAKGQGASATAYVTLKSFHGRQKTEDDSITSCKNRGYDSCIIVASSCSDADGGLDTTNPDTPSPN